MKKLLFIGYFLLASETFAQTNAYLNLIWTNINTRLSSVTNLEAQVAVLQTTGLADLGFSSQVVTSSFTQTDFTDIDLSPWIGTNAAVVGVVAHANSASTVLLRPNGQTNDVDSTTSTGASIDSGKDAYMVLNTDTNGVIEADVTASTDFTLLWFIRRHEFE